MSQTMVSNHCWLLELLGRRRLFITIRILRRLLHDNFTLDNDNVTSSLLCFAINNFANYFYIIQSYFQMMHTNFKCISCCWLFSLSNLRRFCYFDECICIPMRDVFRWFSFLLFTPEQSIIVKHIVLNWETQEEEKQNSNLRNITVNVGKNTIHSRKLLSSQ